LQIPAILRYLLLCCVLPYYGISQEQPENPQLKLAFVGDIMGHSTQIASAAIVRDSLYDYRPCFAYVAPVLQTADLVVGNLELTLPGKGPYTGYPRFRSPDQLAQALSAAGFDLLVTANNHSNDGNRQALEQTIHTLREAHFFQTGTFLNAQERAAYYPLLVYKGAFKLAFLNYTYGTNGLPTTPPNIVNLIDEAQMKADLAEARALRADFIIVVMHWGAEYQINENKEQAQLAKNLFSWGADLIVGAHPHVVQPIKKMEVNRPDSQKVEGLVAYSLGNFISGQRKEGTNIGLIFEVTLEKQEGQTQVVDHTYVPVFRHIETRPGGETIFRVVPVAYYDVEPPPEQFMPSSIYQEMQAAARSVRNHLKRFASRERSVSLPQN